VAKDFHGVCGLPELAPGALRLVEVHGWVLAGYEHIDDRHADLSPEPPNLT
jgi:hypothetical protein